jgi:hypothetical protein
MIPSVGRIVHYTLNEQDAEAINRRRSHARAHMPEHQANSNGVQVHVGNAVSAGEVYPLVITKVCSHHAPTEGTAVNGQVLLDGNDLYWATSVDEGEGQGHWAVPPRV